MYIIVVGGGKIGLHLSKYLIDNGHEVLVLEKDPLRCERIAEELGHVVFRGDGCEAANLEAAGAARADILIATTGDDEDNLVACQVSKHRFEVPRTISIINDPRNETLFKKLGVNVTVSATRIILSQIEHLLPEHPLVHLLSLEGPGLEMVSVRVPKDMGVDGKRLGDVLLPTGSFVSLVISKEGKPQTPAEDLVLMAGDEIVVVTPPESQESLRVVLTGDQVETRR